MAFSSALVQGSDSIDQGRRVLVVDDDRDFAEAIQDNLEERGYVVKTANDPGSALEANKSFKPHSALIDIRLGRENGVALASQLKAQRKSNLVCVMITAYAELDSAVQAVRAGVDDYLRKPLNKGDLLATLERGFAKLRLMQAKKAAEEALQLAQFSIDHAADSIAWIGPDGRLLHTNRQLCKRLRYSRDELLSMSQRDIDPDFSDEAWRRHWADLKKRGTLTFESSQRAKDGRIIPIEVTSNYIEFGGNEYDCAIARDITERKQAEKALRDSEEQLRLVADAMPMAIGYVDSEQRYRFANSTYEAWFDRPRSDIIGLTLQTVLPEKSYETARPYTEAALAGEKVDFEETLAFPDGATRHVRAAYIPHVGNGQAIAGYFTLIEDITQQRQMETQLRQIQKQEVIGQLTGGIAHDFNNILAIILGALDLLEPRVADDGKAQKLLQACISAGLRGSELTQRLLAFARQQPLQPEAVDVNGLIEDTSKLIRGTVAESIEIRTDLAKPLWRAVADPGQLEGALLNLVINARDAMPEGGTLTIRSVKCRIDGDQAHRAPELEPGDYVLLSVTDTGLGMPAEVAAHAFEPFFTTKEVGQGSGLGLSMVYGFARQSGGYVGIESEEGHGTTVNLYLPRARKRKSGLRTAVGGESAVPTGNETVLVVEDDPDLRRLTVTMLADMGYTVFDAADGPSALAILDSTPRVDVLFTDVVMPGGMNGWKLAQAARKLCPGVKVLYMSGYAEHSVGAGKLDANVRLLDKPFKKQDLTRELRSVLNASKDTAKPDETGTKAGKASAKRGRRSRR